MSQINESSIKTPGVYVNEIPSFPPSIAQVATAIPVFVGYTQMAIMNGKNVINQAVRISSLVEYITYFGMGPNLTAQVTLNSAIDTTVAEVSIVTINSIPGSPPTPVVVDPPFQLFNSIQMFFKEGGSACYILSVGLYPLAGANIDDFISPTGSSCFDIIQKEDEPTLIVIPDAIMFTGNANNFYNLMTSSLNLCGSLQDRFTIIDVLNGDQDRTYNNADVITLFRNGIGSSNLNYGAVYYPWLNSSLPVTFNYENIQFFYSGNTTAQQLTSIIPGNAYVKQIAKTAADQLNIVTPTLSSFANVSMPPVNSFTDFTNCLTKIIANITTFTGLSGFSDNTPAAQNGLSTQSIFKNYTQKTLSSPLAPFTVLEAYLGQLSQIVTSYPTGAGLTAMPGSITSSLTAILTGYNLPTPGSNPYGTPAPSTDAAAIAAIFPSLTRVFTGIITLINNFVNDISNLLTALETQITATSSVYANIKNAIANKGLLVPPSGAMAGIYASVDATRGVWKAPANVSLSFVISPAVNIDDQMQEDLNVDTNAGKSVNAIRAFTGKGTLVWGARTLTGNDNNFRYISVRRFYIMVETSTKSAAFQFVFEPNDIHTWLKVKAMIENYLFELWQQGALAGIKPEQAYYVKVGIGQTMTSQDILEGRMIVEIGMAVVRPAEFIILRFTQMQQQS
jgi:phage tail sheath protein FI